MPPVTQNTDISDKIDIIIQAAQKVFGLYGFEKTSMKDIAKELNFSKASLYYYFLDKESLFKAVIQKEQKEFIRILGEINDKSISASEQLNEYVVLRHHFFRVFLNVSKLRMNDSTAKQSFIHSIINELRAQEIKLVIRIFQKGVEKEEFIELDPESTTTLFMDIIKGLRIITMKNYEASDFATNPEDLMLEQLKIFTRIFINGITKNK